MKKWTAEALSITGMVLILALLGSAALLTWHTMTRSDAAIARVEQSHQQLAWLRQFRSLLYRAEHALKDTQLAPGPSSATERADALRAIDQHLQRARALPDDDGLRRAPMAELQQLARTRLLDPAALTFADTSAPVLAATEATLEQAERMTDNEHSALWLAQTEQRDQGIALRKSCALLLLLMAGATCMTLLLVRRATRARDAAHARVSWNERRYRQLVDTAQEGIWLLGVDGCTRLANQCLGRMFACSAAQMMGRPMTDFLPLASHPKLMALFAPHSEGDSRAFELRHERSDGSSAWASVSARHVHDEAGKFDGTLLMLSDITERKLAEQQIAQAQFDLEARIAARTSELALAISQLRAEANARAASEAALCLNEQRLQEIVTMMPVALFIKDADSRIILMNQACEQQWGVRFADICGTRGNASFPPEQISKFLADDAAAFANGAALVTEELAWDASLQVNRLVQTSKKPFYDAGGKPAYLIGISADISERKRTEQALQESLAQMRQLSAHMETIKEDERKRIAIDIHDELGQNLLALKIDVAMLHTRTASQHPRLNGKITRVLGTLDATIGSVRNIINELHPSILELGLAVALDWLLKQFERRTGIVCHLTLHGGATDTELDQRRTDSVFRIVQEALGNVLRHAGASAVQVTLTLTPLHVALVIADDGAGMQHGAVAKVTAFGLRGIRERVDAFGGQFAIDSRWGNGTALSIKIPLSSATPPAGGLALASEIPLSSATPQADELALASEVAPASEPIAT